MAKKREFVKFGFELTKDGFLLSACDATQMRLLADLASIDSDRISSFGPVTEGDTHTQILFVKSRQRLSQRKGK